MLCVAIIIVGAILFICSCVIIGMLLSVNVGSFQGYLFSCVSIGPSLWAIHGIFPGVLFSCIYLGTSIVATRGDLPKFFFVFAPFLLVCGVDIVVLGIKIVLVNALDLFFLQPAAAVHYVCRLIFATHCFFMMLDNSARLLNSVWCVRQCFWCSFLSCFH